MCGRFAQSENAVRYAHALDPGWTPPDMDLKPTWNMAPSLKALVFHDDDSGHVAELQTWGLLPSWADPKNSQKPINARVETAATKPYFRRAWKTGRCLIPADGWYEWTETPTGKVPFFIHSANNQPIFMAGLYETNAHAHVSSFTILTREASDALREIHEREPLVLSAAQGRDWIRKDLPAEDVANLAQHSLSGQSFAWHVVSTRVNSPRNDGADLIAPSE